MSGKTTRLSRRRRVPGTYGPWPRSSHARRRPATRHQPLPQPPIGLGSAILNNTIVRRLRGDR